MQPLVVLVLFFHVYAAYSRVLYGVLCVFGFHGQEQGIGDIYRSGVVVRFLDRVARFLSWGVGFFGKCIAQSFLGCDRTPGIRRVSIASAVFLGRRSRVYVLGCFIDEKAAGQTGW